MMSEPQRWTTIYARVAWLENELDEARDECDGLRARIAAALGHLDAGFPVDYRFQGPMNVWAENHRRVLSDPDHQPAPETE